MTDSFRAFFSAAEPIVVKEPLAEILGAFSAGPAAPAGRPAFSPEGGSAGTFAYTFSDLVKLAGHACPTMAGAWLSCQSALRALYPGETPVRGQISVTVYGDAEEG